MACVALRVGYSWFLQFLAVSIPSMAKQLCAACRSQTVQEQFNAYLQP